MKKQLTQEEFKKAIKGIANLSWQALIKFLEEKTIKEIDDNFIEARVMFKREFIEEFIRNYPSYEKKPPYKNVHGVLLLGKKEAGLSGLYKFPKESFKKEKK